MNTFLYRGLNENGFYVYGSKAFNEKVEMEKELDSLNITNYEIYYSNTPYKKNIYSLVSAKELSIFCKQISVTFFSYITIVDGILLLSNQTENKILKTTLKEIYDFLEQGYTFSQALSMYEHIFGQYLVEMACIGEQSGTLDIVFSDLSNYFNKEHEIRKRIKGAIIYPTVLSVITFCIFAYLVKNILPLFDSILQSIGADMSPMTNVIMSTSRFLDKYFILILFIILICLAFVYIYFVSDKGKYKFDTLKAKSPYISFITNRVITARFSRSLSLLLRSGMDIHQALDQSAILIKNAYLFEQFKETNEKIKQGESLSKALEETNIFPSLFVKMVTIGERTGNLDEMLSKTTEIYEEEAFEAIDRTTKLIEPILITLLSIVMGVVLLAIIMPMITIMNAM